MRYLPTVGIHQQLKIADVTFNISKMEQRSVTETGSVYFYTPIRLEALIIQSADHICQWRWDKLCTVSSGGGPGISMGTIVGDVHIIDIEGPTANTSCFKRAQNLTWKHTHPKWICFQEILSWNSLPQHFSVNDPIIILNYKDTFYYKLQ